MITFIARVRIKPGQEAAALARVRALVAGVRAEEPGVLAYMAHQREDNPREHVFYEAYADEAARDAHGKTAHFAAFLKEFGSVFDEVEGAHIENLKPIDGVTRAE